MTEEELFFLTCLRLFLKGGVDSTQEIRKSCERGINWHLILSWSHWHGVTPLVYHTLKESNWAGIPNQIKEKLERIFWANTARNLLLAAEIDKVFEALGKRGVRSIPIKGIFLSEEVYPDISFRMMTDIDILIRREDLMMAEESLTERGYYRDPTLKENRFPDNCYTLHMEKGKENGHKLCVELHWSLANSRDYTLPLQTWWEKTFQNVPSESPGKQDELFKNETGSNPALPDHQCAYVPLLIP